jgi:hypothetical protein
MQFTPQIRRVGLGIFACLTIGYVWMIHGTLFYALPDPFFSPDSGSYLMGGLCHYFGAPLRISGMRGMVYPLFLAALIYGPRHFQTILAIQHLLLIITALLSAGIFRVIYPSRPITTLLLFMVTAIAPRATLMSHSILSEGLFTTLQMAVIYLFLHALHSNRPFQSLVAGGLAILALNTRPIGVALLIAMGIVWLRSRNYRRVRRALTAFALGALLVEMPFILINRLTRGSWGDEAMGSLYLYGNLAEYLDLTKVDDSDLRTKLEPFYSSEARPHLKNKNWTWWSPDGPVTALQNDARWSAHLNTTFTKLAWQAFCSAPLRVARDFLHTTADFLTLGSMAPLIEQIQPKEVTLQHGFDDFYKFTESLPVARSLLKFQPDQAVPYFRRIQTFHLYPFDGDNAFWLPAFFIGFLSYFSAVPAILCGVFLTWGAWRARLLVQLLFAILLWESLLVAAGGISVRRYGVPLEPLFFILCAMGISQGLRWKALRLKAL